MTAIPKVRFYLVHLETGQRYPIGENELVIGKSSGDLLFPEDQSLSPQHCRILMTPSGPAVQDLGTPTGTALDGKTLPPGKAFAFKLGNLLTLGGQAFKLQEPGKKRKARTKRRSKTPTLGWWTQAAIFGLGVAALHVGSKIADVVRNRPSPSPTPVISPYEMVDREVESVFDLYKTLGEESRVGRLKKAQLIATIRQTLLPDLSRVQLKLGVVRPQSEYERRKLEVTRKLVVALIGQVGAMADNAESETPENMKRLQQYSEELQALGEQSRILRRTPAQDANGP